MSAQEETRNDSTADGKTTSSLSSASQENEKPQDVEEAPAAEPPKNPWDPASFPDGGATAWLCVLGGFCSVFVSFGWINCIGVFQNYWQTHQLSQFSPSDIGWITSLEVSLMFFGGSWVGRLYDNYGPRWLLLIGTFLHVFGLMMSSISSEYYQFILSQAVCSAIGCSMIFYSSLSPIMTWFFKKRAVAVGIVSTGGSIGGMIFPIMVQELVKQVGYGWTMRICAFLILGLLIISNLFVKSRFPPKPHPVKIMDFIRPLGEVPFALLTTGMFLFFFGQFIPFTFIILEATTKGMSPYLAGFLVPILNAASIFGRILPAFIADRYGRYNVMCVLSVTTFIIILALWIPASSNAAIIVFAVIFGFTSGVIVSLPPALIAQISDVRQIGVRTGTVFSFVALAVLASNPIGGALITADGGNYVKAQIFAGVMMAAGSVFYIAARVKLGGLSLTAKV